MTESEFLGLGSIALWIVYSIGSARPIYGDPLSIHSRISRSRLDNPNRECSNFRIEAKFLPSFLESDIPQ
ncbi:hypothetical protein BCR43DRAFT_485301 [Syncephalastrum racemosum]|uniref:Uncharacterized protein n=1 Tax=Syncephalastrum racemosum TaxID=13706 RepID=A0A1X2HMC3_SYNRA|nr:hypothetical protein BCR43DRAFT_485301 [Syncephalastrum racemosum]